MAASLSSPPTRQRNRRQFAAAMLMSGAAITSTGCLGLAANFMHAAGLDRIPAEYDGLEDASVAVVVLTETARPSDDPVARDLTRRVGQELIRYVDDIQIVREDRVADWCDRNGWDSRDFEALGRDVAADQVLVIEVANLKLRDGATMYKGIADVNMEVIDVESGHKVHSKAIEEFSYPKLAGQHANETTEKRFRGLYLGILAAEITRAYRPYDSNERVALDSRIAGLQ